MTTQAQHQIEQVGEGAWVYRAWLVKTDEHLGRSDFWYAVCPYEMDDASFEAVLRKIGVVYTLSAPLAFGRRKGGNHGLRYPTIESCIDAFETALGAIRDERWAEAMEVT